MNGVPAAAGQTIEGCVLFTDLVGFTEYTEAAGDRLAVDVLDRQTAMVDEVLDARPGGRVVKELGDGVMLWFGSAPTGLESSVALLLRVAKAHRREGFPLAVRMGMHHGEVTTRGDDIIGRTVNIAARVSALAGPGELLVSEEVIDACDGSAPGVEIRPVGPTSVRGVGDPIWLNRVVA